MPSRKRTVSVRLDPDAARRLEKAAQIARQSQGAFLEQAGEEAALRTLKAWAVAQRRAGTKSYSELADETGLAVEEIMEALSGGDPDPGLEMFLASCRTIARLQQNPEFFRMAEEAVDRVRSLQH